MAEGIRRINEHAPVLLNPDNLATLVESGSNAGNVAWGLLVLNLRDKNLLTLENRKFLIQNGARARELANALSTLYLGNSKLVTPENCAALAQNSAHASAIAWGIEKLCKRNPTLVTQDNFKALIDSGANAEAVAEGICELVRYFNFAILTPENRAALIESGANAKTVAWVISELNWRAPASLTPQNRAALIQNNANAEVVKREIRVLFDSNRSLATEDNFKALIDSGVNAEAVAWGLALLYDYAPDLINQENRAILVQNGANAKTVARDMIKHSEVNLEFLHAKFGEFGKIEIPEIALVIAAKGADSVYVVPEITNLIPLMNLLVENPTKDSFYRLQFVLRKAGHSSFGEAIIDKTGPQPKIKMFFCNPVGEHQNSLKFNSHLLSEKAIIEFFTPKNEEALQRTNGCSYFSLDGAFMLRNQEKYDNIYKVSDKLTDLDPSTHIVRLPTRMKRSCQYYDAIKPILESKQQEIVNKKGQTAAESIKRDLKEVVKNNNQLQIHNNRIERKMMNYGQKVMNYIKTKKINNLMQLYEIVQRHSLPGLQAYCESQLIRATAQSS